MGENVRFKKRSFNKKGFEVITNWVVIFFVSNLILSFLLAYIIVNEWVAYAVAIFTGVIFGRLMYMSRQANSFPYYLLAFAFIGGYVAGHRAGNWLLLIAAFILAVILTKKISKATDTK